MKRFILFCVVISLFCVGCTGMHSQKNRESFVPVAEKAVITLDDDLLQVYFKKGDFTGAQLRKLAVENGIIPKDADQQYFMTHKKEKNAVALWMVYSREEKIQIINSFKNVFKLRGATVSKPAEFYVDRVNSVLSERIRRGQFNVATDRGVMNIFKTIAIFDGDYADGRPKIVILRQWIGEENFEIFRKNYPDRYRRIAEMAM